MLNKEYLEKLKEEDYVSWDNLVNDPMVKGTDDETGCVLPILLFLIMMFSVVCYYL